MTMLPAAAPAATVPAWIGVAVFAGPILAVALAWLLFRATAGRGSASAAPGQQPGHGAIQAAPVAASAGRPAHSLDTGRTPETTQGLATVSEVAAVLAAMADLKPDGEPMTRADVEEYVEAFRAFKQQGGGTPS